MANRWKFQGQEHIDDLGLNWVSFKWRNHDPAIGRFFNVDPLAESYVHNSPYAFSENKVTTHIELEGLEAIDIKQIQKAAIRDNVLNNVSKANESAKNIVSGKVGVQAAGIGGKLQLGNIAELNIEGKALSVEAGASGEKASLSSSVVTTEFGISLGDNFEISGAQEDIKTELTLSDGGIEGDIKLREQKGKIKVGNQSYSTDNEFSIGATLGNFSAEVSANLDAASDYIDYSAEAVQSFFGNLINSIIHPEEDIPTQ